MIPHQSHPQDAQFLSVNIKQFPYRFRPGLSKRYSSDYENINRRTANLNLLELTEKIKTDHVKVKLISSDYEIVSKAKELSKKMAILRHETNGFLKVFNASLIHLSIDYLPDVDSSGSDYQERVTSRLSCSLWWRRALRKQQGRAIEKLGRNINLVNLYDGLYATDETVHRRIGQRARNRAMLAECNAVNELGDQFTLEQLSDKSVSNPEIKRGELMTRIAGFEEYAKKRGDVGEFWTITLPSKYHSCLSKTGQFNPKYAGSDPRNGQKMLAKMWQKVRASFARRGINVYGFRVAEPQHDGTPHWHMLLFMPEAQKLQARAIYQEYALQEDGRERGALKYRFKAVEMNRGGAAGYIAKYISKNIDGYGMENDLFGKNPEASAIRVDAWASTWGIRQFQQIGGHSVTVWRELRRLSDQQIDKDILNHWFAADSGDWCAYLEAMDKNKIKTALIWSDKPGRYNEPAGWQIIGVSLDDIKVYVSRIHEWTITRGSLSAPWSPVNNCTEVQKENDRKSEVVTV